MMFIKKREIDPSILGRLHALPEAMLKAKMEAIARVTSLADEDRLEDIGEDLKAPWWAIAQVLDKKEARRYRWIKAAAILAGLTFLVALAAWFFPITDQRPKLASTGGDFNLVQLHPNEVVQLQWTNIGTRLARRATVTIFTFGGGKRQTKLGDTEIVGGHNIMPGSTVAISMDFNTVQLSDGLLACVIYRDDDDKKHKQIFLYR
jgi:hypothetical protein